MEITIKHTANMFDYVLKEDPKDVFARGNIMEIVALPLETLKPEKELLDLWESFKDKSRFVSMGLYGLAMAFARSDLIVKYWDMLAEESENKRTLFQAIAEQGNLESIKKAYENASLVEWYYVDIMLTHVCSNKRISDTELDELFNQHSWVTPNGEAEATRAKFMTGRGTFDQALEYYRKELEEDSTLHSIYLNRELTVEDTTKLPLLAFTNLLKLGVPDTVTKGTHLGFNQDQAREALQAAFGDDMEFFNTFKDSFTGSFSDLVALQRELK